MLSIMGYIFVYMNNLLILLNQCYLENYLDFTSALISFSFVNNYFYPSIYLIYPVFSFANGD